MIKNHPKKRKKEKKKENKTTLVKFSSTAFLSPHITQNLRFPSLSNDTERTFYEH